MDETSTIPQPPAATARPPVLDGYEVLQLLGAGGTGSVWVVRRSDGMRFAAKVVDGGVDDLDHEASLLQAIRHEHIVRLVEVQSVPGQDKDRAVLVTELAEGGSLAQALRSRERLTPGELVTVLCPVARALHDLHGLGVVHADLSPGNILLTADGKPLVADLGVSRLAGTDTDDAWATEAWAAPEVLAGGRPTAASDTYSLGAIAWAALAGDPPGPAAMRADLADLTPEAPEPLRELITSCLEHDPRQRPRVGDVALRLWDCADPEPAPVAGSTGTRRAQLDPAVELTRRIRAQARHDDEGADEPEPPWWRLRLVRRVALAGALLGTVCGVAAAVGPAALAWAGDLTSGGASHRDAALAAATSPASHPSSTPSASDARTTPAAEPRTRAASARPPRHASVPARPVVLVQRLVRARALSWRKADRHLLKAALQPGSTAYRADRAALDTADRQGVRYDGLEFTVTSAVRRPGAGGRTTRVRATIDRSAYTVVGDGERHHVAARHATRVDLWLRRTSAGWRITDWRPVTSATTPPAAG